MDILFNKVMPHPLASIDHSKDSIWGNVAKLESGKHILLNASSGKGKSTFSMCVFGVRHDYSGEILYNNQNIKNLERADWVEIRQRKISTVFQDLQLFPKLSVGENLLLKNELTNFKTTDEIIEMLAKLGVDHKWNDPCSILSMGQQQRVAIVRALCMPFQWLVLDEPFSHLDDANSRIAFELMQNEARKQNAGLVLTSLDPDHRFEFDYELKL